MKSKLIISFIIISLVYATAVQAQITEQADSVQNNAPKELSSFQEALKEAYQEIENSKVEMADRINELQKQINEIENDSQNIELKKVLEKAKHSLEAIQNSEIMLHQAEARINKANDLTNKTDKDTLKLKLGDKKVMIIDSKKEKKENDDKETKGTKKKDNAKNKYWAGVELGVTGYVSRSFSLQAPKFFEFLDLDYSRSSNLSINFIEKDIKLYREFIKLVSGLGFTVNSYALKNNVTLAPDLNIIGAETDTVIHFDKNKLKTYWFNLPVIIGISSNEDPKKAIHLSGGLVLGYKAGSKPNNSIQSNLISIKQSQIHI